MLKTMQWIYRLGVKNERRRIAALLQNSTNGRRNHIYELKQTLGIEARDGKGAESSDDRRQADEMIAVDRAIILIIKEIFDEDRPIKRGGSYMFPEDDDE